MRIVIWLGLSKQNPRWFGLPNKTRSGELLKSHNVVFMCLCQAPACVRFGASPLALIYSSCSPSTSPIKSLASFGDAHTKVSRTSL